MSNIDLQKSPAFFSRQVTEAQRFFLLPREQTPQSIVVGGGFERAKRDYRIHRARLQYAALEYVVGGRGRTTLGERTFDLSPGMFFLYDGSLPQLIETDPQQPLEKYFIDLRPRAGKKVVRDAKLKFHDAWPVEQPADLRRLFDELLYYGTASLTNRQAICDALLRTIVLAARPVEAASSQRGQMAFESYQRCCRTIHAKALKLRSLSDLADACQLDPAYMCRLFQRFDRLTPHDRLIRRRMDLAAAQLCHGGRSIKEVARDLGYGDQFNFSRSFKSVFGVSPARFRATYARDGR